MARAESSCTKAKGRESYHRQLCRSAQPHRPSFVESQTCCCCGVLPRASKRQKGDGKNGKGVAKGDHNHLKAPSILSPYFVIATEALTSESVRIRHLQVEEATTMRKAEATGRLWSTLVMFPLLLAVLNRDSSTRTIILSRTASMRGNIPSRMHVGLQAVDDCSLGRTKHCN